MNEWMTLWVYLKYIKESKIKEKDSKYVTAVVVGGKSLKKLKESN